MVKAEYLYVVYNGLKPGIYATWNECKQNVKRFKEPLYRKFSNIDEVKAFWLYGNTSKGDLLSGSSKIKIGDKENVIGDAFDKTKIETQNDERQEQKTTAVYVKGFCPYNSTRFTQGGFGVFWAPNDPRNASEPLHGQRQTNKRAAVQAVLHALQQDQGGVNTLDIRTDSLYAITAVTSWYKEWVKNGWLTKNGKPVANRDLFEKILELTVSRPGRVIYTHVSRSPSHEGLEMAALLADIGANSADRFK